jgi:small subunit ribosomal protein S1
MTEKSRTNVEENDKLIDNQVVENSDRADTESSEEITKTEVEEQKEKTASESAGKKKKTAAEVDDKAEVTTEQDTAGEDVKTDEAVMEKSEKKTAKKPTKKTAEKAEEKAAVKAEEKTAEKAEEKAAVKAEEKTAEKAEEKAAVKAEEKTAEKAEEKIAEKTGKKAKKSDEGFETPDSDFDWDALNENTDAYNTSQRQEYEKMYSDTLSTVAENEVVEGTVISMSKREVVINIGYKSEGVVSLNEFRYNPELQIGEKVEVYVESQEDKKGQLILSHKKARALKSWDRVNEALDKDEIIKGYIKCRTKGGMIVDVFGIEAFLPGSQIDVKPIRDYDVYVGKTMEFKVVKINHEFKNVVVSHKALIEAELEQQKKEIIAKLEKGQILEGTVKNITSYGVFIDLGGVDGLIHITDLSWGRVNHPEEIVQLDQKLQVVILDFDDEKKRIALGLKQLSPHPWDSLDANLSVGNKVKGRVVVMADYGAFVEIAPGVEGLIHVSEMSWSQHLRSAQEFLKVGDEVEAVILTLDRDERKMSLGMKQLKPDPWENIEEKYASGSKHTAKVRNFTNFGVFVEIEEGVDGLIHISDLSWTKKIKHPAEFTNIGDEIEVVVLEIDKDNRRLSLGHKQLEENPWDVFETIFTVDSIHEGTIIEISDKGAVVALPYGVEGFVTPKHLVKEDGSAARIDEKLNFKVIEFSKSAKKIVLSHSRTYEEDRRASSEGGKKTGAATVKRTPKKVKSSIERTTLGDITDLAALKDQLEKNEKQAVQKKKEKKEDKEDKEKKEDKEDKEKKEDKEDKEKKDKKEKTDDKES